MEYNPFKKKISDLNYLQPQAGLTLVAEPFMEDDYFKRAVVLLTEYNEKGAVGFILNTKLDLNVGDVMDDFPEFDAPLFLGGPVEPQSLFYIHCVPELIPNSIKISDFLHWNGDFEILKRHIKSGEINPRQIKFFLGYSGWGLQQLKDELELNSWIIQEVPGQVVLSNEAEYLWKEVILNSTNREISQMAHFPKDPSLN